MKQSELTASQFGATAGRYLTSAVHAGGADLERLAELAARSRPANALDLGCGAGHVSFALARGGAAAVVAYDPAQQMLDVVAAEAAVRGLGRISTRAGAAEALPFAGGCFNLVATRFSAHHWLDVRRALREVARVLAPEGRLIVIDVLAPEAPLLDTALQTLELLRDASHVRSYRESEWRVMLAESGFETLAADRWKLPLEFNSWVARIATPPGRVAALKLVFDGLPSEARQYLEVAADYSFSSDAGWIEAVRII